MSDDEPKPKKPKGWYSRGARDARLAERVRRRRLRALEGKLRANRVAERVLTVRSLVGAADQAVQRIQAAAGVARAREAGKGKRRRARRDGGGAKRNVDVIFVMARRGQIGARERRAAEIYREAFDVVQAHGMTGTLNPDRSGGGGGAPGRALPELVRGAAERLNEADRVLGDMDRILVEQIVGQGRSIEEMARRRFGSRPAQHRVRHIGQRIRDALGVLADLWVPAGRQHRSILSAMAPDARPTDDGQSTGFQRMKVAHAGRRGVEFSGGKGR